MNTKTSHRYVILILEEITARNGSKQKCDFSVILAACEVCDKLKFYMLFRHKIHLYATPLVKRNDSLDGKIHQWKMKNIVYLFVFTAQTVSHLFAATTHFPSHVDE